MTTKVCIYTRVSTIMQVDGFSLIGQEEEIRKYCACHNMEIVATYSDKGKSGKTLAGREDFQKMITDIDTGVINVKYVMVYKLSRFGRSVLDIERTLQILRENDVNLICVADGLDTSTPMGKVITTIMSSLAEMELENIHTQTMLGRQQKARDGLWNGGFAPYGYALENGHLVINDDEADAIKKIFELYTTTELGIVGIVKWLFKHGYRKEIRANGTRDVFTRAFVSKALDNPVYKGEIAYGRRHMLPPDKKGERKMVKRDDYIRAVGKHEPIITEEQYEAAQQKRKTLAPLAHKREDSTHVHMLATLVKCPVCGAPLYGNTTRKKKKGTEDEYTPYHFYACKHRLRVDGKPCTFRKNLNEKNIDEPVIAIITKLAGDKRLAELVADKLGDVVDEQETVKAIETTEREIRIRESSLKRLSSELDRIDPEAPYAERRIKDTNARIDELYEELAGFETDLADFKQKLEAIRQKKLTVEKVYTVLQHFGTLIDVITEEECQMLMRTLIDEIQIFEDKQPDGRIVKSVKLSIPVVYDGEISARIGLDKNDHDESIVCLSREKVDDCKENPKMISEERSGYKSWSNLKKQMHDLLCDSLKDKISYFYTSYHEVHNAYGRATINYCKKEIAAFSWIEQYAQQRDIIEQYKKMDNVPSALVDFEGSMQAYRTANATATKEKWMPNCTLCETDFINSLTIYLKTDIKTSLNSDNYLLRVFAYMDRRIGKRTLVKIKDEVEKLPEWVKQFYQIRCEAEGFIFPPKRITDESVVTLVKSVE